jgi:hypothetical protein
MSLKRSLVFFSLFVFANTAHSLNDNACIEPSVAAVAGLVPGMDKKAINAISKYSSLETGTGVDDGGQYTSLIYHFTEFKITVVQPGCRSFNSRESFENFTSQQ